MTSEYKVLKSFEFKAINDNEMRKFEAWGSVEVTDRHGEIVPAEEVYKIMDIWMDRGAPIQYMHTNRNVGKGLNWQKAEKNGKPGVLITGLIYKHYAEDDEVWNGIKKGEFEGLSIGGKSYYKETDDETGSTMLRNLIGYEFSVVDRCGNQEATFTEVNAMAKSDEVTKEDPLMEETSQGESEDRLTQLEAIIKSLVEKIAMIEEKISGEPEEETPVEETKEEEEETEEEPKEESEETQKSEEEEVPADNEEVTKLKDELSEMKKSFDDLKKSIVSNVIKAARPADDGKKEDKYTEVSKSLDEMAKSGKISFTELGKQIRG